MGGKPSGRLVWPERRSSPREGWWWKPGGCSAARVPILTPRGGVRGSPVGTSHCLSTVPCPADARRIPSAIPCPVGAWSGAAQVPFLPPRVLSAARVPVLTPWALGAGVPSRCPSRGAGSLAGARRCPCAIPRPTGGRLGGFLLAIQGQRLSSHHQTQYTYM